MSVQQMDSAVLKKTLKEALAETLTEQRDALRDILLEVIEDIALAGAIREGRETEIVDRDAVMEILEARS